MKKILIVVLTLLLAVCALAGCAQPKQTAQKQAARAGKLQVVTTSFAPYDFARAVAGDAAELTMLLPPAAESHSFEPTPQDIIKLQNCDVFIYVGGESDEWVRGVLDSMDTSRMRIVTLMDCVEPVEEEIVEGMEEEAEEEQGDADAAGAPAAPEYDEHVWTSPRNAKLIVEKISEALCASAPDDAATFKSNTEAYLVKLDALDGQLQATVDSAARKTIVFGDRFPFRYLADAYGLKYFAAFPGCSTETEANAATVKFLIDKVRAEKLPVVFYIELSNQKMANSIAEATGAEPTLLHAGHNVSKADFEAGKTYLDFMADNVAALKKALH
jgi:zinc transport system substrate-binding protein